MKSPIDKLRGQARSLAVAEEDLFLLLAKEACSNCCQEYMGGNKTCPPPPSNVAPN